MSLPSLTECAAIVDRFAPVLLDTAVRSVLVLAFAGVAALALRRASAAARHWAWLLGFAGLLLLPAMLVTLPGWRILPRVEINRDAPIVAATIAPPWLSATATPARSATQIDQRAANMRMESPKTDQAQAMILPVAAPLQGGERMSAGAPLTSAQSTARIALPWTFWVVVVWLGGILLMMGHVLLGYLSLGLLQRRCVRIGDGDWSELLNQLCEELEIHRAIELLSSPLRTMPMTWGLWRTRLLLPEQANNWPAEQRRSVLLHELGHVRRHDCLTQLLAQIGCALYWFNPLVWVAWRRMQIERERACDDLVLNTGARASAYADHLLHSASDMTSLRFVGAAALAMARPSTLEERLRAILDAQRNRQALSVKSALATILLLVLALVPVAALHAQENPAPAPVPGNTAQSVEEQMKLRRAQDEAVPADAAAPATRPAFPAAARRGSGGGGFSGGAQSIGRGGVGGGGGAARGPAPLPILGQGPTCPLDATIYEVHMPGNQIGRLDVDALSRAAATADGFEKALAELGATRPLYRANDSVRLAGDSITIGTTMPYISNSQITARGDSINTVAYSNVGALFSFAGRTTAANKIELDLSIQVSNLSESNTAITGSVKAPFFHTVTMVHKGPVQANQPFVVISVDAAAVDPDGKATAYIARVTLGAPQPSSSPAAEN